MSTHVVQRTGLIPTAVRTRRAIPTGVWYALAVFGCALVVVLIHLVFYLRRSEPRDARAQVERELRTNTLQPGERVLRSVPVFRRNAADYFRRTRGFLVLTDRRLVYLGAPPRDITGASGAAPTFDQRQFPIDTAVRLERSTALLGFTRALKVEAPEGDLNLALPTGSWSEAQLMRTAWESRHRTLHTIGAWGRRVRDARKQLEQQLAQYRRQPVYHVVRAGDAISSIASWYETSPEKIRELNAIEGNKIKVGQRLLIRSGS
jgi:hypothetical protein